MYQKTIQTPLAKLNALEANKEAEANILAMQAEEVDQKRVEQLREREGLSVQVSLSLDASPVL